MYFTSYGETYCVNCDWLQFSVLTKDEDPEILCPDGMRVELCQGNNIFQYRALLFDGRGAKVLTLLWHPYSKVLNSHLMTCQVANEYLYLPNGLGIRWAYDYLLQMVDCSWNAVGRLDICIDFIGTERRLEILKALNGGGIYAQGKKEGSSWWHEGNGKKLLHCLTWGSPNSEIKVKVYHKSREQGLLNGDQPEKPWIVNEWKEAGLDIRNVWRLEFSMCGAGQLRYEGQPLTLEMCASHEWLLGVLLSLYEKRFVCRYNQGKRNGHHNDDKRVYLLRLPTAPNLLKWAEPKGDDYEMPASITLLRSMMRQIDNPVIMSVRDTFTDYANTILNLINLHRLDGYFVRTYEREPNEYFEELWQNVGTGIRHTTPAPSRLMD